MLDRSFRFLCVAVAAAAAGCAGRRPLPVEPVTPHELPPDVVQAMETHRQVDHRPHEFVLHPREERPRPLVAFNRVLGWALESEGEGGQFERTDEQQLWGPYVGKVVLPAGHGAVLRPPEPIPLRDRFDTVRLWVKPREPLREGQPGRTLEVLVRDAGGEEWAFALGAIRGQGWRLLYDRVPPEIGEQVRHPVEFVGLRWSGGAEEEVHYLDSLALHVEHLTPLSLPLRPRLPVDWPPGHALGLHTGEETLPFPADPSTVVPSLREPVRRPQVEAEDQGVYRFSGMTDRGPFAYRVEARDGAPVVSAALGRLDVGTLFAEAGIRGEIDLHGAVAVSRREGDRVRIEYASGAWYEFRLIGRSLVVDAYLRGGEATHFEVGPIRSAHTVQSFSLPGAPAALAEFASVLPVETDEAGAPVFVSRVFDTVRSAASEIEAGDGGLGVARYLPLSNGRRSDLYERLVLTVAERLEEVLPTIAHDPAPRMTELAWSVWRDLEPDEGLADMAARAAADREMGLVQLVTGLGEEAWQDTSDNATLRIRASDRWGGDEALADWMEIMQGHGIRVGLDIGYTEMAALNEHWSADRLLRDRLGGWRRAESGRYGVKPVAALALQEELAPVLANRYAPGLAFAGALMKAPPWRFTDYDDRVPGAGGFVQAWASVGELLGREREALDAPVIGTGGPWFYAGLADGLVSAEEEDGLQAPPYLPVFELIRVQPLSVRFGLGRLDPDVPEAERSDALDRLIAGQLAYGRNGRLPPPQWGDGLRARAAFAMQAIQGRYVGRKAERIAYWDGERYVSASRALASGVADRSQVYVQYDNGLEVWVNGAAGESWEVRVGRAVWTLPPFGWVAAGDGLLALSATLGEARVDFVKSPEYLYWDGRGSEATYAEVASAGPLVIRVVQEDGAWVLDVRAPGGTRRFGLGEVIPQGAVLREAALFGEGGAPLGVVEAAEDGQGLVWVKSEVPIYRAVFRLDESEGELPEALAPTVGSGE